MTRTWQPPAASHQKIKGALAAGTLQVRLGVAAAAFLRNETRLPTNATGDVKVKLR